MVKVLIGFVIGVASVGACIWCYKKGFENGVKKCQDIVRSTFEKTKNTTPDDATK